MQNDPIFDEIRRSRLEIEKECEGDFDQIHEHALEVQDKVAHKVISHPDPSKMTMSEIDEEISAYRKERKL
jgi:hypothetical protein